MQSNLTSSLQRIEAEANVLKIQKELAEAKHVEKQLSQLPSRSVGDIKRVSQQLARPVGQIKIFRKQWPGSTDP